MMNHKYLATPEDGKEILRILESSAAKGSIELLYTRRPDAYASYMKECPEARVFVSRDGDRAIGTCAELIRDVYIGGSPAKAAYLCGLKKDAAYEGSVGFGVNLIRSLQSDYIDFYYCSVVADNTDAQKMFEKGNRLISMTPVAEYTTYILNPKAKVKTRVKAHDNQFRRAEAHDLPHLLKFLNEEGKKKDLFPVIHSLETFHNLSYRDFYLLLKDGQILATAALWNQTDYKQYVVKKYRGIMKFARVLNPVLSMLGYIKLPRPDTPLDFPMLSFFLSRDDNEAYYQILLREIMGEIRKRYGMLVIGLPKNHFGTPILKALPSIHFDTRLYEISFPWSDQAYRDIRPQVLHPECGWL